VLGLFGSALVIALLVVTDYAIVPIALGAIAALLIVT
jgi:hypothetical protein